MSPEEIEKLFGGDINDLYKLYSISNRDDILNWMLKRPSADITFKEVEGDKEIIAVIPTADASGKLASTVKALYKEIHIIYVESKGPFFNYARSVNAGVKYAMQYSPRWVIVSNDDLIWMESVNKLRNELSTVSKNVDLVMASKSDYHTYNVLIVEPNTWFIEGMRRFGNIVKLPPAKVYGELLKHRVRLGIKYITVIEKMLGPMASLAGKGVRVLNAGSFMIVKPRENLMDPNFINSHEDVVLSMTSRYEIINFKLREKKGASLGFDEVRFARIFVNEIYLNYLIENKKVKIR
ncbi:hypothetical protein V6M85_07315 [Sulfolobus tengchongensis]|uniref:Glycosyltransferase n=1 Tax=Sulfolobus tengchongensis TaxID=207809 RepID=A0AAX4KXH9_9CREN